MPGRWPSPWFGSDSSLGGRRASCSLVGALFFSAFCGNMVTLAILALGILEPYAHYYLFIMPLNFICIGVLAEALLKSLERGSGEIGNAIAGAAALIFIKLAFSLSS